MGGFTCIVHVGERYYFIFFYCGYFELVEYFENRSDVGGCVCFLS